MRADFSGLTARSDDGRSFVIADAAGSAYAAGSLIVVVARSRRQLALVEERSDTTPVRLRGRLIGELTEDGIDTRASHSFDYATVQPADVGTVQTLHDTTGAMLEVGVTLTAPGGPARLLPKRFNRHTFWCGQSGSGKTYALGVVLEQLVAHTALPVVIFDPNADFVRLGEPAPDASGPTADALRERDIRVLRPNADGDSRLRASFLGLPLASKAAVLQIDPIADREEFNELIHLRDVLDSGDLPDIIPQLRNTSVPARQRLALRVENLRLTDWEVWAQQHRSVTDVVAERPDVTVLDLGGFSTPEQQLVVALALLDDLWARREERRPVLLVIDEAHNLASPHLDSPIAIAVRERLVQIAAEGRKFGLWLLLSTQRPSKVHPGIISQCDNLALMKMTSPADLAELGTYFGYAPAALLERSPWFRQGEALFAGGFVPAPALVKVRKRLTREGGSDVDVPLR
ncbi:ATP-binding protein [Nocardia huaxiensis]|uniref:ATP-binding protein n=1 Tax=Nocardia huaxiensis TaxID=2755382 RepID=A0A7D6VBW5_9NOCA|nr:ATP-binding protein [Nocardia huaxiensis]QLY32661.1 ATP-binding protein [Nocardia huaxiensis]UFS93606.1 ATP-binding protein [Nocardia huaxiensis]